MGSERVTTTPDQWKRVGAETQESRFHRVHAQKDWVHDIMWRFVAVRKGDGINPCKQLGEFDNAKSARECCELDSYEFHWDQTDVGRERGITVKGPGVKKK